MKQRQENESRARVFARSLDSSDYEKAREQLHPEVCYAIQGQVHQGADAILASYKDSEDRAREKIEKVVFTSTVIMLDPLHAVISFQDRLEHKGQTHCYQCRMHLNFDPDGRIRRIAHEEIPGQREQLLQFFAQNGLKLG